MHLFVILFAILITKCSALNETLEIKNLTLTQSVNTTLNLTKNEIPLLAGTQKILLDFHNLFSNSIGKSCTTDSECKTNGTKCENGTCKCSDRFVPTPDNKSCKNKAESLGDPCEIEEQCSSLTELGNVVCMSFRCMCGIGTRPLNGRCIEVKQLGGSCKSDITCSVPNSKCVQNICACKPGTVPHPNNERCLAALRDVGESCTLASQCQQYMGDYANCVQNICVCQTDYHFNTTACIKDKALGEPCSQPSDCQIHEDTESGPRRDCLNKICSCAKGFSRLEGENYCKNGVGKLAINIFAFMIFMVKFL